MNQIGGVRKRVAVRAISLFFVAMIVARLSAPANAQLTVVAYETEQAVGEPAGVEYVSFGEAVIGRDGTIGFGATVAPNVINPVQTEVGYTGTPSALNVACLQGAQVNAAPAGADYLDCGILAMGNSGLGTGVDYILGGGIGGDAICGGTAGTWTDFAVQGQTAPGTGGATYDMLEASNINATGQIAFTASLTGTGVYGGIFLVSGGVVSNVAVTGLAAPGVNNPFFQFNTFAAIGDSGQVVFSATTGVSLNLGPTGIWSGTPGSLQLVAATGLAAPGVSGGVFNSVSYAAPSINHAGQIAFRGGMNDAGSITSSNDSGIWSNISGSLTCVAQAGTQAAGLPTGTKYTSFEPETNGYDPVLNDAGQIAFISGLSGDGSVDTGVFLGKPGAFKPIVIMNQAITGLPSADKLTKFDTIDLNDLGQMIIIANFSGPGVDSNYDTALLAYNPTTGMDVVAMSGVTVPGIGLSPQNVGIVSDDAGYQPDSLSDTGEFVFGAEFNSPGDMVITGYVPEPSTMSLAIFAAFPLLMRRRSRKTGDARTEKN